MVYLLSLTFRQYEEAGISVPPTYQTFTILIKCNNFLQAADHLLTYIGCYCLCIHSQFSNNVLIHLSLNKSSVVKLAGNEVGKVEASISMSGFVP